LSHDLQANCAISFCFHLYLMLHACAARFDVTKNFKKFLIFLDELNNNQDKSVKFASNIFSHIVSKVQSNYSRMVPYANRVTNIEGNHEHLGLVWI
jgi:hypothetical protein